MIGIVLVSHGNLAEEFAKALEHIVGEQSAFATISLFPHDDIEANSKDILEAVQTVVNQHFHTERKAEAGRKYILAASHVLKEPDAQSN